MEKIAIYTLTSVLNEKNDVDALSQEFLSSLGIAYDFKGNNYADFGSHDLDVIYVRTGGTEGIFRELMPMLQEKSDHPFYLLTSGKNNSLGASMEILSYLRLHNIKGEIIHGQPSYVARRLQLLSKVEQARRQMKGCRLAVIGKPSDWLIASTANYDEVKEKLGIELIDISMDEMLSTVAATPKDHHSRPDDFFPGAEQIYEALKTLLEKYELQGFTMRCFDLLNTVHNTGCWAVAKLNSEGYVAGCEGDIPALLTMMITRQLVGVSGFLANPSTINPETGEILFAHCTIPLDMVERYELDTHFESGIGIGIRGFMKEGSVTVFKVAGDLKSHFIAEGDLRMNLALPDMCRTQQVIQLRDRSQTAYFLNSPIGNHHIVMPGRQKALLEEMLR